LADKTSMTDWTEQHSDVNDMQQRNEVGSNEADDLKATEELQNTRNKNKDTLDKLQTALPMPAGVADKKPPPAP
ncbi:MAG TPA: hypothetical protein VHM19_05965, partial [Polyangiales bacterium]|nr:hypothetical protein [Polyangiales bacterium]